MQDIMCNDSVDPKQTESIVDESLEHCDLPSSTPHDDVLEQTSCSPDSKYTSDNIRLAQSFENCNNSEDRESALAYNSSLAMEEKSSKYNKDTCATLLKLFKFDVRVLQQLFSESNLPSGQLKLDGHPSVDGHAPVGHVDLPKEDGHHFSVGVVEGTNSPSQSDVTYNTAGLSVEVSQTAPLNDEVTDVSCNRPMGQGETYADLSLTDEDDGPCGEGERREDSSSSSLHGDMSEAVGAETHPHTEDVSLSPAEVNSAESHSSQEEESTRLHPDGGTAATSPTPCSTSANESIPDVSPCGDQPVVEYSETSKVECPDKHCEKSANDEKSETLSERDTNDDDFTVSMPHATQSSDIQADRVLPYTNTTLKAKPEDTPLEVHDHSVVEECEEDEFPPLKAEKMETMQSDETSSSQNPVAFSRSSSCSLDAILCFRVVLLLTTVVSGSSLEIDEKCTVSNVTDILSQHLQEMWNSSQFYQPTHPDEDFFTYACWIPYFILIFLCLSSLFRYRTAISKLFLPFMVFTAEGFQSMIYSLVRKLQLKGTIDYQNPSTQANPNVALAGVSQSSVRAAETSVVSTAPSTNPSDNTAPSHTLVSTKLPPESSPVERTNHTQTAESGYYSPGPVSRSEIVTLSRIVTANTELTSEETSFQCSSGQSENEDLDLSEATPLHQQNPVVEVALPGDLDPSELVCNVPVIGIPPVRTQLIRGEVEEETTQPNERSNRLATLATGGRGRACLTYHLQTVNLESVAVLEGTPTTQIATVSINPGSDLLAFNASVYEPQRSPLDQAEPEEDPEYTPIVLESSIPNVKSGLRSSVALPEAEVHMFQPGIPLNRPVVELGDVLDSKPVYPILPALPSTDEQSLPVWPSLPDLPSTDMPIVIVPATYFP